MHPNHPYFSSGWPILKCRKFSSHQFHLLYSAFLLKMFSRKSRKNTTTSTKKGKEKKKKVRDMREIIMKTKIKFLIKKTSRRLVQAL